MILSLHIGKGTRKSDLVEEQTNAYLSDAVFMNISKSWRIQIVFVQAIPP